MFFIFNKISTGALSDLEKVTKQARAMVTVYGLNDKVGNHAARSILSDKGYNIYEIPTVILTSHKAVKGTLQINNNSLNPWVIFNKVRKTYKLSLNDLTIIGYTPNSKISKSIGKIINLQNRIVLDPVMGDIGIGLYVEKDVANFFKKVITKVKYISANFHYQENYHFFCKMIRILKFQEISRNTIISLFF